MHILDGCGRGIEEGACSKIARIIRDERYAGHMVAHKRVYEKFESECQVDVDKSEWIIVRNTHEGIVTQEEFDRANAKMRRVVQRKKKNPANKKSYSVIVCPHCGLRLRPDTKKETFMYCPTGRANKGRACSKVRIKKELAERRLVKLVRQQAEMFVAREAVLEERRSRAKSPGIDVKLLKAEVKRLGEGKIADYERYKAGEITREVFIGRKGVADARTAELESVLSEAEVLTAAVDEGELQYGEALRIKDYLYLEAFDKRVMASLISSARVMGEDCLEVTWKYGDVYEKFLTE